LALLEARARHGLPRKAEEPRRSVDAADRMLGFVPRKKEGARSAADLEDRAARRDPQALADARDIVAPGALVHLRETVEAVGGHELLKRRAAAERARLPDLAPVHEITSAIAANNR